MSQALSAQSPDPTGTWNQILGNGRDGRSPVALRVLDWPASMESQWVARIGSGYGGAAIVAGSDGMLVLVLHRQEGQELLSAFSLDTGKLKWETGWKATYQGTIDRDEGPRCVPVAKDGLAICYGVAGDLAAVNLTDGTLKWHRRIRQEYGAEDGYFGAGSTPLIVDGLALVEVGSKEGGVVAVELETGKTAWSATSYDSSYSSPIAIPSGSRTLVLCVMRLNVVLLDPKNGQVLGDAKFGSRGPTVNAATPIAIGNNQYWLTASYGVGSLVVEVVDGKMREVSRSQTLASQYNTPVRSSGRLFGIDGREDVGVAALKVFDLETDRLVWQEPGFGLAHLVALGETQVLTLGIDGGIHLWDANLEQATPVRKSQLPRGTYRALPAISGSKLICRRILSATESELMCIELEASDRTR